MAFNIVYFDKKTHLLCVTDGKVSNVDEYLAWAMEIVAKAKSSGHKVLLMDNRTFSLELTPLDVVSFADKLDEMGAARLGLRIGVVSNPGNPEVSRLVETSLVNRSATYRSFRNQADAMEWLKI